MTPTVLGLILLTQTCGGLASILTKLALGGLEPWTLVALRQGLAAGHGLLGEPVGGVALAGCALMAAAVALETRAGRPRSVVPGS